MSPTADTHRTDGSTAVADPFDRQAVADLLHRLAAALDEQRFTELGELFTVDGSVATPGGEARGRPAVVEQARRTHAQYRRTQHRMTNVLVDVHAEGAEAQLRADAVARFLREGPEPVLTAGAVYRCRAVVCDEGWRLAQVEVEPIWRVDGP